MESVDVIIPTYHPGQEFEKLLQSLENQKYPVKTILVMNTEEKYWNTQGKGSSFEKTGF